MAPRCVSKLFTIKSTINAQETVILNFTLAPKAWLNQGLPGCKPGWTNQTFLVFKPGLPDFTECAKSLVNQGIPGKSGKPGYSKNQENQT